MKNIKVSAAQFENRSGDKRYNLSRIEALAEIASLQDSQVVAFHESSVTGYTFARHLSKKEMLAIAEIIPEGESQKAQLRSFFFQIDDPCLFPVDFQL